MAQESVVYGCITDMLFARSKADVAERRDNNQLVTASLPASEDWPLLCREMFSAPRPAIDFGDCQTDVIHFGSSYKAIEHEWDEWIKQFEKMLHKMYWVTATVHLQTAYNGTHTFVWQAEDECHVPGQGAGRLRCEWVREDALG
ncbi:MAG: hypothetical protein ACJA1I_002565 [Zhongshania marina]|jgi:hypothetical protein|uniref:Uncharacterized protein n=1 Tax=Zhongshania marina TaxID=2304603 RepID=A0A2S4HF36_9GAMM|nr:hypothetical protein [Marortus luteolus]POP52587.1 hypothetical protein C0068_11570 [Marortus luteolus]RNL67840.1 hypothetical protein D0911_00820 [Zhongshania marina]